MEIQMAKHMDVKEDKKLIKKAISAYAKKDKAEDKKMVKKAISRKKK